MARHRIRRVINSGRHPAEGPPDDTADRRVLYIDEVAAVPPEVWGRSIAQQADDLQAQAAQADARVRQAVVLEKLARDFGPETAKLAAEWFPVWDAHDAAMERASIAAEAQHAADRRERARIRRNKRKLDAAGRYGFR